jgi:hypothetical protein
MKLNFGIASDKLQHMIAGAIIGLIVMGLAYHFNAQYYGAYGIIAAWVVGWAKEFIWDAAHPLTHTVDVFDMVATGTGGILSVVTWKLSYAFIVALLMHPVQAAMLDPALIETRYIDPATEHVMRLKDGSIRRRADVLRAFQAIHPCPSTGLTTGKCPGWEMNHDRSLACGGRDAVSNLSWMPIDIKTCAGAHCVDRYERKINALAVPVPDTANCVNMVVK